MIPGSASAGSVWGTASRGAGVWGGKVAKEGSAIGNVGGAVATAEGRDGVAATDAAERERVVMRRTGTGAGRDALYARARAIVTRLVR